MGSHHQMTPVNDGTQPEASFSGAGDTKVEGKGGQKARKMKGRSWIFMHGVLVVQGMVACCCSMLLGTLPSRHLMGQLAHNSHKSTTAGLSSITCCHTHLPNTQNMRIRQRRCSRQKVQIFFTDSFRIWTQTW